VFLVIQVKIAEAKTPKFSAFVFFSYFLKAHLIVLNLKIQLDTARIYFVGCTF